MVCVVQKQEVVLEANVSSTWGEMVAVKTERRGQKRLMTLFFKERNKTFKRAQVGFRLVNAWPILYFFSSILWLLVLPGSMKRCLSLCGKSSDEPL